MEESKFRIKEKRKEAIEVNWVKEDKRDGKKRKELRLLHILKFRINMSPFPLGIVNAEIKVEFRTTLRFCTRKIT